MRNKNPEKAQQRAATRCEPGSELQVGGSAKDASGFGPAPLGNHSQRRGASNVLLAQPVGEHMLTSTTDIARCGRQNFSSRQ